MSLVSLDQLAYRHRHQKRPAPLLSSKQTKQQNSRMPCGDLDGRNSRRGHGGSGVPSNILPHRLGWRNGTRPGYPLRVRLPCGRSRGAVHKADAAGSVPRHWPGYLLYIQYFSPGSPLDCFRFLGFTTQARFAHFSTCCVLRRAVELIIATFACLHRYIDETDLL